MNKIDLHIIGLTPIFIYLVIFIVMLYSLITGFGIMLGAMYIQVIMWRQLVKK